MSVVVRAASLRNVGMLGEEWACTSLKLFSLFKQTGVLIKLGRGKTLNGLGRLSGTAKASQSPCNERQLQQ